MATLTLRPISDASLSHSCSAGSSGYVMINESSSDGDSTYIYQSLTSKNSASLSSTFNLGGSLPTSKYNVTAARLHFYARDSDNNVTSSASVAFSVNGSGAYTVSASSLSTSYSDYSSSDANMVSAMNAILNSGDTPVITASLRTTGKKSSNNKSNGYIRVTQIYLELDYEEIVEETSAIYVKENNSWKKYSAAYKKNGGVWSLYSDLGTLFEENKHYVKAN